VKVLVRGSVPAGSHGLVWDRRDEHGAVRGAGVYFVRARIGAFHASRKLVVLG
jgi:hypothetical protein